jgi:hypothetical protein
MFHAFVRKSKGYCWQYHNIRVHWSFQNDIQIFPVVVIITEGTYILGLCDQTFLSESCDGLLGPKLVAKTNKMCNSFVWGRGEACTGLWWEI